MEIDLEEVIAIVRPDLLQMYVERDFLGLMKALTENKYLQDLGELEKRIRFVFLCHPHYLALKL